ncbi:Hypothetical predicted protein [Mytilus galloprovincialis]|uniref:Uncharacterized protein n=1 Tax=Mytilus galloprovincialis TaxID=29158 RepID=A0A8B6G560_MYTGA|nr:Hypothetical predicted protein [Mytilus galloprovincialis]
MSINGKFYDCVKIGRTCVLTDYKNSQLIICNSDGSDINHIPLPDKPNNLTEINSNTVAVSCRYDKTILIVNITTGTITSKLKTVGNCYGIASDHEYLYVVIVHSMIQVMDLTGTEIRSIPFPVDDIEDITVNRNRLVCIDYNTIYCCSLNGTVIWKFRKSESYQDLRRVTTDDRGTVYVTNGMTDSVVVVSNDGKHFRELITSKYGLNRPSGIHFDKDINSLFVCNDGDGKAFLFYVREK